MNLINIDKKINDFVNLQGKFKIKNGKDKFMKFHVKNNSINVNISDYIDFKKTNNNEKEFNKIKLKEVEQKDAISNIENIVTEDIYADQNPKYANNIKNTKKTKQKEFQVNINDYPISKQIHLMEKAKEDITRKLERSSEYINHVLTTGSTKRLEKPKVNK